MPAVKKRRWWLIGLPLIAALGAAGLYWGGFFGHASTAAKSAARAEKPPVAVTVEPVTLRPIRRTVSTVGSLWGHDEVEITPKVEGRVLRVHRDIGDVVQPGDMLLELDPTDYQLAVEEARRALELELAKLGMKELPSGTVNIANLPMVVKAAAQETNAASRRDRTRRLAGAGSAEDRELADTEYAVARANHNQAILEAETTLAAARHRQASLQTALQRLADTKVIVPVAATAPKSNIVQASTGSHPAIATVEYVVCHRDVAEGEMVRPLAASAPPMFRLVIDRPLKLKATIPERHRGDLKIGQDAELTVEAYPGKQFYARVARVNPAVDRSSRTFEVEIAVPNQDRQLSPGSFARVSIQVRTDPAARTVPEEALLTYAGVTKIFIVQNGKAREVLVRPGLTTDEQKNGTRRTWIEVEGDIPAKAQVVTSGHSQLADGTAVRVKSPEKGGN